MFFLYRLNHPYEWFGAAFTWFTFFVIGLSGYRVEVFKSSHTLSQTLPILGNSLWGVVLLVCLLSIVNVLVDSALKNSGGDSQKQ